MNDYNAICGGEGLAQAKMMRGLGAAIVGEGAQPALHRINDRLHKANQALVDNTQSIEDLCNRLGLHASEPAAERTNRPRNDGVIDAIEESLDYLLSHIATLTELRSRLNRLA